MTWFVYVIRSEKEGRIYTVMTQVTHTNGRVSSEIHVHIKNLNL